MDIAIKILLVIMVLWLIGFVWAKVLILFNESMLFILSVPKRVFSFTKRKVEKRRMQGGNNNGKEI